MPDDQLLRFLAPLAEHPRRSAVVVDFDGTLAPVVDDPTRARALPASEQVLARLAASLGRVAVVSGRPVSFLRDALRIDGLILAGQYGVERLQGDVVVTDPRAQASAEAVETVAREAETALPGLLVERKNGIAVTLHWRTAPELEADAMALGVRLAERYGLAGQPGRLALELRPPLDLDKGTVVRELARGCHAALMAGDDLGDLAAFSSISGLVDEGECRYGLRVAVRSPETPPAMLAASDHQVDGPAGLAGLLGVLADLVESS
ncbi:MAG: trehalose-phosphatase [Acidimicrobiia bacterium]